MPKPQHSDISRICHENSLSSTILLRFRRLTAEGETGSTPPPSPLFVQDSSRTNNQIKGTRNENEKSLKEACLEQTQRSTSIKNLQWRKTQGVDQQPKPNKPLLQTYSQPRTKILKSKNRLTWSIGLSFAWYPASRRMTLWYINRDQSRINKRALVRLMSKT